MLLYGAARDPATCKPTKDSEIAAARLRAPCPRSYLCPPSSLYPYGTLSRTLALDRSHCLFLIFLLPDRSVRSESTAGQYRNVFTAIQPR